MKVLIKKLKRVEKIEKIFYYLALVLYIISYGFFLITLFNSPLVKALIKSGTAEKVIILGMAIFFGLWLFIYILCGLLTLFSKKKKTFIFITIITFLLSLVLGASSFIIRYVDTSGSKAFNQSQKVLYTTNLISLKETNFDKTYTIGMLENETSIEGNKLAKKLIEDKRLTNNIEYYEDYTSMISDLYKGNIGACFVPSNYAENFKNEVFEELDEGEKAVPIEDRVKVLYDYSEELVNEDTNMGLSGNEKTLTEPFTVLIMGVDSAKDGLKANQAFNGDTLILATFNPNTLTATMFSIPRDMYVPIACNNNRYAKINSSAAYGSKCVINTVEQLTDIQIDYYVKINFKGVVDLVDAVGGVEVDVEKPNYNYDKNHVGQVCEQDSQRRFGDNLICIDPGLQKLNGEEALAYSRCRHLYLTGDIARNQHQQQVIEAIAKKMKDIRSLDEFNKVLDAIANNMETNITYEQILTFYTVGRDMLINSNSNSISIKKTYLQYYNLPVWLPKAGMHTSALGYYPGSLEEIKTLMRQNLELESVKPIKTFSISYNEEYTTKIVGKGITSGARLELVKSFVGNTQFEAANWCASVGLNCSFETISSSMDAGLIADQSAHKNELVKSIKNITFYISDGTGVDESQDPEDEPTIPDDPEDEPIIPGGPEDEPDEPETPDDEDDNNNDDDNEENNNPPTGDDIIIPTE